MEKVQKAIKVLVNTMMILILIIGIVFIILFVIGIEPFVVKSGSMQPAIQTGSLCFINKNIKYEEIKENDIIAFISPTENKVTHRVVKIREEGFETKGDSNKYTDGISTTKNNYIGKNIFSIPKLGYVVKFIQTTRGKIILATIIIAILVAGFLGDSNNKRKNKEN